MKIRNIGNFNHLRYKPFSALKNTNRLHSSYITPYGPWNAIVRRNEIFLTPSKGGIMINPTQWKQRLRSFNRKNSNTRQTK